MRSRPITAQYTPSPPSSSGTASPEQARFDSYRGKYAFHCHDLEHEDTMMVADFEPV